MAVVADTHEIPMEMVAMIVNSLFIIRVIDLGWLKNQGSDMLKEVPHGLDDMSSMSPPCILIICRLRYKPMPEPPGWW